MASYGEIVAYLGTVPGAAPAWAEALYSMGLTMDVLQAFVATMAADRGSPLREAEEGVLSKEIVRMNAAMGAPGESAGNGRMKIRLHQVLSAGEQARVVRLVGHFCQPVFNSRAKFAKSSHGIMTATRRAVAGYHYSRVVMNTRVLEVGPDVNYFVASEDTDKFSAGKDVYLGARVAIGPRDVIRMQWGALLDRVLVKRPSASRVEVVAKAEAVRTGGVMVDSRVEEMNDPVDGIVSTDANYDLDFSAMPGIMARTHARWWYGTMCRAKGLTRQTKLNEGRLELSGTTWRVDWKADRIDFRHPSCAAFGYSHKASNYMRYEEHNGYVWNARDAHYVYSKGPETNDELLFFSVHRVAYAMSIKEPVFIEHPQARQMRLESVWAVGDEVSGVPQAFEAVTFHVDALNFSKVFEKRRALDYKGDIGATVNLVRSTNVCFFLNGTPVGASTKIEAKLAEATAVVVEVMCAQQRLSSNMVFDRAMAQFTVDVAREPWVLRMLESIVNVRAAIGCVVSSVHRVWEAVREPVTSAALRGISQLRVSAVVEGDHVRLTDGTDEGVAPESAELVAERCFCEHVAELRLKMRTMQGYERMSTQLRLREYDSTVCVCVKARDAAIAAGVRTESAESAVGGSGTDTASSSGDGWSDSGDGAVSEVSEVTEGQSWQGDELSSSVETLAMEEVLEISRLQVVTTLSECRVDAQRIWRRGLNETVLAEFNTTRTTHAAIEFLAGVSVRQLGKLKDRVSAVYSVEKDAIVPITDRRGIYTASVPDGWYYTCSSLKVWNHAEITTAVQYALDYGKPVVRRSEYNVVLGVPGAGKTYQAMKFLSPILKDRPNDALYLGVTKAAVKSAVAEAVVNGVSEKVARARCMTLDSYLHNKKLPTRFLVGDEAPAEHIGKFDAAVAISGAKLVRLYGDGRQVEYSPFVAGYVPVHSAPGRSIPEENYEFLAETHRCSVDVCAAWVDKYPAFYPCECHRQGEKDKPTMNVHHVNSLAEVPFDTMVRYHAYRQDEKEEVRGAFSFGADMDALRARPVGGLSTVHEDQGSTHRRVASVRVFADYDKNQSSFNPSLYNKDTYVLSDTTRHTEAYDYYTLCAENDGVQRAIRRSKDPVRLAAVAAKTGVKQVSLQELWA